MLMRVACVERENKYSLFFFFFFFFIYTVVLQKLVVSYKAVQFFLPVR